MAENRLKEVPHIEIPHRGYKSPITLFHMDDYASDLRKEINAKQEEYIMQSIVSMGIDVDKNELIKALQYDREQYEKGYKDGKEELQAKIDKAIEEIENNRQLYEVSMDYTDGAKEQAYSEVLEILKRNIGE